MLQNKQKIKPNKVLTRHFTKSFIRSPILIGLSNIYIVSGFEMKDSMYMTYEMPNHTRGQGK